MICAALAAVLATNTWAESSDAPPDPATTSDSTAPTEKLRDLCTDRPTKSSAPCTVDAGHFQIEADLFNVTLSRSGGVNTNTYLFTNPTLKYGITSSLDIEATLAPVVEITTRVRDTNVKTDDTGVGDLYVRAKLNLAGNGGGNFGIAIAPYVKIPTAGAPIGNGVVEGGVLAPISISLPAKFSMALDPELDILKNALDDGRHANLINLVAISHAAGPVTLSGELWSDVNFDPSGSVTQYSGDVAVAWAPKKLPDIQFDGGLNFGLNRATPAVQAYIGVSHRF